MSKGPTIQKQFPSIINPIAVEYNIRGKIGSDNPSKKEEGNFIPFTGQETTNNFPNPVFTYQVELDDDDYQYNCTVQWSVSVSHIIDNQKKGFCLRNYAAFLTDASIFHYVYAINTSCSGIITYCPECPDLLGCAFEAGGTFAAASPDLSFQNNQPKDGGVAQYDFPYNGTVNDPDSIINVTNITASSPQNGLTNKDSGSTNNSPYETSACPNTNPNSQSEKGFGCCGGQPENNKNTGQYLWANEGTGFCPISMFDFKSNYAQTGNINFISGPWIKSANNTYPNRPNPLPGEYPLPTSQNNAPNEFIGWMPTYVKGDYLGNNGIPPGPPINYSQKQMNSNIEIKNHIEKGYNGGWSAAPNNWKKGDSWSFPKPTQIPIYEDQSSQDGSYTPMSIPIVYGGPQITLRDPRKKEGVPHHPIGGWWWDISNNPSEFENNLYTPFANYPDPQVNQLDPSDPTKPLTSNKKYPTDSQGRGLVGTPYGSRLVDSNQDTAFYQSNFNPEKYRKNLVQNGDWGLYEVSNGNTQASKWNLSAQPPINPTSIQNGLPKECDANGNQLPVTSVQPGKTFNNNQSYYFGGKFNNGKTDFPIGFPSSFNNAFYPGTIQPFISWAFCQGNTSQSDLTENNSDNWKQKWPGNKGPPAATIENGGGGIKGTNFLEFDTNKKINGWYPSRQQASDRSKYPPVPSSGFYVKFGPSPVKNSWRCIPGLLTPNGSDDIFRFTPSKEGIEDQNGVKKFKEKDIELQFTLLDIIPMNSTYGAIWGQSAMDVKINSETPIDPKNAQSNPRKISEDLVASLSFPKYKNLKENPGNNGIDRTGRFGKYIQTYPSSSNAASLIGNEYYYSYNPENNGEAQNQPFVYKNPSYTTSKNIKVLNQESKNIFQNNLIPFDVSSYNPQNGSRWICGGIQQVSFGDNPFIEERQKSLLPNPLAYNKSINNDVRRFFPYPSTNVKPGIKNGIAQQFADGVPACEALITDFGSPDSLPKLNKEIIYVNISDPRCPNDCSFNTIGIGGTSWGSQNATGPYTAPKPYPPISEQLSNANATDVLIDNYRPWIIADLESVKKSIKFENDINLCIYTTIIRQQWVPNNVPAALDINQDNYQGLKTGIGPIQIDNLPSQGISNPILNPESIQGWNCDWCGLNLNGEGWPSSYQNNFFNLLTNDSSNTNENNNSSIGHPLGNTPAPSSGTSVKSNGGYNIVHTSSAGCHIVRPPGAGPLPPPPPLPPGGNDGGDPNPGFGPGQVFILEGKCLNGQYNCQWIRPRPWLSINYQPIAGQPLPYKYIQTMGSLLAKKRQRSAMIQNATAHRKNTVVFLSRGKECTILNKCKPPPICPQCTGNRNPNNNPI